MAAENLVAAGASGHLYEHGQKKEGVMNERVQSQDQEVCSKPVTRRELTKNMAMAGATLVLATTAATAMATEPLAASSSGDKAGSSQTSQTTAGETLIPATFSYEVIKPVEGVSAFSADPIDGGDIVESLECDVAICGAGLSGMVAALSCAENGLKVVVLEKGAECATRGAQIGAINSTFQSDAGGYVIDPIEFVEDGMASMGFRADRRLWKKFAERSGEALDWLIGNLDGACGDWVCDASPRVEKGGVTSWPDVVMPGTGMPGISSAFPELASKRGIDLRFSTPVVQLIQGDDRSIQGVIAKSDKGLIKISAARGIVLATGGYENNWEMLCQNIEPRDLAVAAWLNTTGTETGDGHLMGLAVGAAMDDYPHVMMNDPGVAANSGTSNFAISQPFLRVNRLGERFINESVSPEYLFAGISYQPGARDFIVMSGDITATLDAFIAGGGMPLSGADLAEALKSDQVEADSLEELAAKINVDSAQLQSTVDAYNACCDAGEDTDFGKDPAYLIPIREAPFYACEEGGGNLTTASGLKINERSMVLDEESRPIPGLYALGNVSGSMFDNYYPHHCQAVSHGRCVTFGYLVGRDLAGLE